MDGIELPLVLGVLLVFGLIIAGMIAAQRRARDRRLQISRSLGFEPVEPDESLAQKIGQLYSQIRLKRMHSGEGRYELINVSRKRMGEAEMYLFDLNAASGDDGGSAESRIVAVVSRELFLPTFAIFPKADAQGVVSDLGNRLLTMLIARFGNLVEFPHAPEFERRHLVSSPEEQATRRFLDSGKLARLAQIRLIGVLAGGDLFVLSNIGTTSERDDAAQVAERVNLARDVYAVFRER